MKFFNRIIIMFKNTRNINRFRKLWIEKHKKKEAIVVIGDSHCNFFSGNENISFLSISPPIPIIFPKSYAIKGVNFCDDRLDNFCTLHLGGALAYSLNKYGTKSMAREKIEKIIKILNTNAKILCCFGEIDIRVHVLRQSDIAKKTLSNIIDEVIDNYIEFLLYLKSLGFKVFAWGPISSAKDNFKINPEYPHYGSETDRNIATQIFNNRLEIACKARDIGFVSIFKHLIDGDYRTKAEFLSSDECHLSQKAWCFAKPELEKCFGQAFTSVP